MENNTSVVMTILIVLLMALMMLGLWFGVLPQLNNAFIVSIETGV